MSTAEMQGHQELNPHFQKFCLWRRQNRKTPLGCTCGWKPTGAAPWTGLAGRVRSEQRALQGGGHLRAAPAAGGVSGVGSLARLAEPMFLLRPDGSQHPPGSLSAGRGPRDSSSGSPGGVTSSPPSEFGGCGKTLSCVLNNLWNFQNFVAQSTLPMKLHHVS